ncbi:MAG TPA: hypothetical protein PKB11_00205 [Desulfovibrio sp.]|uniref:hypothetical protein n=1 Tax=Desulfovibrio sp. TaxID=885 RepID=UPI002B6C0517|nr:hypothetical protein [Desulfovibrio sp.]HMM37159.1 hypothetical protein [Desulfovibrio sp.]
MDKDKILLKEIDLIQDVIKRMANNSFLIKGWTITLVVATLLLKGAKIQVFIAFIPLVGFWFLDAYFLRQERIYREIYKWVIANRINSDEHIFDLNPMRFRSAVDSEWKIMMSVTLKWFYGSIIAAIFVYWIIIYFNG